MNNFIVRFLLIWITLCSAIAYGQSEDSIEGTWAGQLTVLGAAFTIVFHIEEGDNGELSGFMENVDGNQAGIPFQEVEWSDNNFHVKFAQVGLEYEGTVSGTEIIGHLIEQGSRMALNLNQGEYQRFPTLDLSQEDYTRLSGTWRGELTGLDLILRFEMENSNIVAFIDSPDQNSYGFAVDELSMNCDEIVFEVGLIDARFSGVFEENSLVGNWSQGGGNFRLTWTKQE